MTNYSLGASSHGTPIDVFKRLSADDSPESVCVIVNYSLSKIGVNTIPHAGAFCSRRLETKCEIAHNAAELM